MQLILRGLVVALVLILALGVESAYSCRSLLEPLLNTAATTPAARKFLTPAPPPPEGTPTISLCRSFSPPGRHG
ncbi:unnamed protein product [Linum trigynum]|uniref:Secreted protein n=1 Tax=Linum trigynum TaxID=586398 RepID=A0AAV2EVF2_9ROSI